MSAYGWIITVDHLEGNENPVIGPSDITPEMTASLIHASTRDIGQKFKMYDDDGELYYSGKIIGDYSGFEPLDDYGKRTTHFPDLPAQVLAV